MNDFIILGLFLIIPTIIIVQLFIEQWEIDQFLDKMDKENKK